MLVENGIVRVGAEIEIAQFTEGNTYQGVAERLINAGHMEGTTADWQQWHQYKCACGLGCKRIKSGVVLDPPLVSMQYDASLPDSGAEFIISPTLLINGMDEMRNIWNIVTENAVWARPAAMRGDGQIASPSIHLHVSAIMPGFDARPIAEVPVRSLNPLNDVLHALSLFGPELILLSDIEELRRGLTFRKPTREADGRNGHHGFIHVRKFDPPNQVYIEWRMFEAAYESWEYFEQATYVSAGLTRALLKAETLPRLMASGYHEVPRLREMEAAIRNDDTEAALALVSPARLGALRDILEAEMYDDMRGFARIVSRFTEVEARV